MSVVNIVISFKVPALVKKLLQFSSCQDVMSTGSVLDKVDYMLNVCDQYLSNGDKDYVFALPVITLETVSKEVMEFIESYTQKDKFEIVKQTVLFRDKALKSFEYGCIRGARFIHPPIITHPKWKTEIKPVLSSSDAGVNILDIGCCFGTDVRYCINLGCDPRQVLGVDISNDFIELGFDYFGDRKTLENRFIVMNVLENDGKKFIDAALKMNDNKLFDIIQIAAVYHLLTEREGEVMMKLAVSLVNKSNGIIFGTALGCKTEGPSYRKEKLRYLHSEQSFEKLMGKFGNFEDISIDSKPLPSTVSKKLLDKFTTPEGAMTFNFFGRIKS